MNPAVAVERYPYITRDSAISAGQPMVEGTRIPVATLVKAHRLGMDFDEILLEYPGLRAEHLHAAFLYYLDHRAEMDAWLDEAETPSSGAEVVPI